VKLTPKQDKFARIYVETSNASEAYRQAYDVGENTKPETVWRKACEVLANGKVAARVIELQERAAESTLVTIESITDELNESRKLAKDQEDVGEMTKATMAKAKIHGLDVHKIDASVGFNVTISGDDKDL
jgi:phage terminase small subunit